MGEQGVHDLGWIDYSVSQLVVRLAKNVMRKDPSPFPLPGKTGARGQRATLDFDVVEPLHSVGQHPKNSEDYGHEADDLYEQPDCAPQNPLGKLKSAGAVDQADDHRQGKKIPGDVGGLGQK